MRAASWVLCWVPAGASVAAVLSAAAWRRRAGGAGAGLRPSAPVTRLVRREPGSAVARPRGAVVSAPVRARRPEGHRDRAAAPVRR